MFATDQPAIVVPAQQVQPDVIEIVGTRSGQALKIDRRTYRIQQNPHSAQHDAIQLLSGLPAVTVSPDNQIMILGNPSVRIFVDGRPASNPDTITYLRTLHGSDIDRIEIITNPSAEYSAEGTGGIINFVLRRKQSEGASGTVSGELSSLVHDAMDVTLKYKRGKWIYELEGHAKAGTSARSSYRKVRDIDATANSAEVVDRELGKGRTSEGAGDASAKVTYQLDSRTDVSAKIAAGVTHSTQQSRANFLGLTPAFRSFSIRSLEWRDATTALAEIAFDHKGQREGETLRADLQLFGNPIDRSRNVTRFDDGGAFSTQQSNRHLFGIGQVDWVRPMGKHGILSLGGNWNFTEAKQHYRFESSGIDGSIGPDVLDQYRAISDTIAGYLTFQQSIGSWTVMPGLRAERNLRRISGSGLAPVIKGEVNFFPSFHAEHRLSQTLELTLSYSRRIDRAQADMLRPYRTVGGPLTIFEGNPLLKDQSTDSYETDLHYRRKDIDAGIILYDRETSGFWATDYRVAGGINVLSWVNAGRSRDRGAEFDLSAPLVRRLKLLASVNLFDEATPTDLTERQAVRGLFRFTSNGTIEWTGPDRGDRSGDVFQVQWTFNSPFRQFQFHYSEWNSFSLSYSHSLSRRVSLTGTFSFASVNRHRLAAPDAQELYVGRSPAEFKVKLLKSFGSQ
jgi:outer membrane receptor protein involved in Fe transport